MTQRSIAVRLRAEVADFNRQISAAAGSLDEVVKASGRGEKAADTFMGRVAQSAQLQGQAWTTAGLGLAGVGGAVTALGAKVLATGVSYNTLRQTSVAALTTLTGSAEAANRQMDKLDAFASTSPFARDVFIRAQQQMLGFGIEAQKVIPYLDSIQNAVAATGGSNHDISELSRIISQISASAKITATDLREFGNRGIDAATLIGSQMGKTGAQIREDITDGALDAGEALDALAAGMEQRYGGAADNVKATFAGAVDRVKAAWRDISSVIAEPLVSRDGGGLGVAGLNALADAMRAFEGLPDSVIQVGSALTGAAGLATLAGGGLLLVVPKIVQFQGALETLAKTYPGWSRFIGGFVGGVGRLAGAATIIGGVTLAVGALANIAKDRGLPLGLNAIQREIRQIAAAGEDASRVDLSSVLSEMPTFLGRTTIEAENLGDVLDTLLNPSVTDRMSDFFGGVLPSYMRDNREIAEALDEALTSMLGGGGADEAAALAFLDSLGYSAEELARILPGAADALVGLEEAAPGAAAGLDEVGGSSEEAQKKFENFVEALASGSMQFVDVMGAWDSVIEKNREVAEATAEATKSSKDSWEDYYDGHTVSMSDYLAELESQVAAQQEWENNITALAVRLTPIAGNATQGILEELGRLGPEGAPLVAALVDSSDEELSRWVELSRAGWSEASAQFAVGIIEAIPLIRAAMTSMGDESIAELAERLRSGESTIQEEIDAWTFGPPEPIDIEADTEKAREALTGFSQDVEAWHPPMVPIDADPWEALSKLGDFATEVEGSVLVSPVDANTDRAEGSLGTFAGLVIGTEESVTVDAFTAPGMLSVEGLSQHTRDQRPDINVGADLFRAKETVDSWHPPQKTIVLNADLSNVRDVVAQYRPQVTARIAGIFGGAADGGLWEGTVRRYADGGIDEAGHYVPRVSQIVQGGRNILWGEPETGWEAYISGKPAARLRNLDIIDDVAKRLGGRFVRPMADGGTVETPAWRQFQSLPASTWQPSPVATSAATGQRPIEVHLHAVPMDHVEETSKALRYTMRTLGLTNGYAGVTL